MTHDITTPLEGVLTVASSEYMPRSSSTSVRMTCQKLFTDRCKESQHATGQANIHKAGPLGLLDPVKLLADHIHCTPGQQM
jgi:hypothetical protein